MGLFRDRAVEKADRAQYERRVGRMKTSSTVARGRAVPDAPKPYTCGQSCGYLPDGKGCPSMVRGGVCPCRCC